MKIIPIVNTKRLQCAVPASRERAAAHFSISYTVFIGRMDIITSAIVIYDIIIMCWYMMQFNSVLVNRDLTPPAIVAVMADRESYEAVSCFSEAVMLQNETAERGRERSISVGGGVPWRLRAFGAGTPNATNLAAARRRRDGVARFPSD